jgi:hypothetical protein
MNNLTNKAKCPPFLRGRHHVWSSNENVKETSIFKNDEKSEKFPEK